MLSVIAVGADSGLGAADVALDGGTLEIDGQDATTNNALRHFGYQINNDALALDLHNNGGLMGGGDPTLGPNFFDKTILTDGPGGRGLDFDNDADFRNGGGTGVDVVGQNDNYSNLFVGILNVSPANAGDWEFRRVTDDDNMGIWLDLDQDGVFESSVAGLGSDRGEQLQYNNDAGVKTVNLAAGEYLFAVTHREGGGGSQVDVEFKHPNMASRATIKPSDAAQAGIWSFTTTGAITLANDVEVISDSTIDLFAPGAELDNLVTRADVSLTIDSDQNGKLEFAGASQVQGDATFDTQSMAGLALNDIGESAPADLTFTGNGIVTLSTPNSYSGQTLVQGDATLDIFDLGALGTGDDTDATGTFVTDSGSVRLHGGTFSNERFTISSEGNTKSPGALHHAGGSGDTDIRTEIFVAGDASLRSDGGNVFRISRGVDTGSGGFQLGLDAVSQIQIRDRAITGDGNLRITGGNEVFMESNAANSYDGLTVIEDNTRVRARHATSLGTNVSGTLIRDQGSLFLEGGQVFVENMLIEGNGRNNNEGVIRNENGNNTINGTLTLTGDSRLQGQSGELLITGAVSGTGDVLKTGNGTIIFGGGNSSFVGDTDITAGELVVSGTSGLGTDPGNDLSISNGGAVGIPGCQRNLPRRG